MGEAEIRLALKERLIANCVISYRTITHNHEMYYESIIIPEKMMNRAYILISLIAQSVVSQLLWKITSTN
jgi:hypothetical protein